MSRLVLLGVNRLFSSLHGLEGCDIEQVFTFESLVNCCLLWDKIAIQFTLIVHSSICRLHQHGRFQTVSSHFSTKILSCTYVGVFIIVFWYLNFFIKCIQCDDSFTLIEHLAIRWYGRRDLAALMRWLLATDYGWTQVLFLQPLLL